MSTPDSKQKQTVQFSEVSFGMPFFIVLFLLIILVYVSSLVYTPALRQTARLIPFTLLVTLHVILHFRAMMAIKKPVWQWLYFLAQGVLVFAIGSMNNLNGFTLGLYMGMAGEAVGYFWPRRLETIVSGIYFAGITIVSLFLEWDWVDFLNALPIFGLMYLFVYTYVIAFMRLDAARKHSQALLQDLEAAHQKLSEYAAQVEELTLSQERQRMARELHDTLAQGLAGLVMQLEAIDSYLENSKTEQAQAVTRQAMQRTRTALSEARHAIQDLRSSALENENLTDALGHAVDQFTASTGIHSTDEVAVQNPDFSPTLTADILRILQEGLRNISLHSNASHVKVVLDRQDTRLRLTIQDDGIGFDLGEAQNKPGRYGLKGMRERAQKLGGELNIDSVPGTGTTIQLEIG
jgi:NarL family two-component system sensor histidine kinase YdfH